MKSSVLVIGGGVTGLAAAHAVARAGVQTTLLEASDRLGGKVRTERVDGFLVESGPDSFIAYRPAAVRLAQELGLGEAIIGTTEPRTVFVRANGRFVQLPDGLGLVLPTRIRPFLTTAMFTPLEKLRMGLDLVIPRDETQDDVAVGAFLRRRLGDALVDRLAGPLLGGVYGTPIDELSLLGVVPQLREAEQRYRSLLLASLASGRGRRRAGGATAGQSGSPGSPFVTLAGGTGQLIDGLVASLRQSDAVSLRTAAPVATIERFGAGFAARLASGERLTADALIVTVPGPAAARLLEAIAPAASSGIASIPYGSTAVVSLGYRLEQFPTEPRGHGFLVGDGEDLAISAVTWSSRKWAGRAPVGAILARAFLAPRSGLAGATDTDLAAAAAGDIAAMTGVRGRPIMTRVAQWPNQMPRYTVGHLGRVDAAIDGLRGSAGLFLAGAAYRGVGLPDCIGQGQLAAGLALDHVGGRSRGTSGIASGEAAWQTVHSSSDRAAWSAGRVPTAPPV